MSVLTDALCASSDLCRLKFFISAINRRSNERRLPSLPLNALGNTDESMERASSMYECIGYESIDQVLEKIDAAESSATYLPAHNRYESVDATQKESTGSGRPTQYKGITCDDVGYLTPLDVAIDLRKTDQHEDRGQESVKGDSAKFPRSYEQSGSMNSNLYLNRQKANLNLDLGKSDVNPKNLNNYLSLFSVEVNPYLNQSLREVNSGLNSLHNNVYANLVSGQKELNPFVKVDSRDVAQYLLDMGS